MINNVVLVGRLTKNVELRKTTSNISTCSFTLAVDRRFKSKEPGAQTADFIQCVAWRQSADFLSQYASKGSVVAVNGSIQTRSYDKDGQKVYITEVLADNVRIIGRSESKPNIMDENDNNYTSPTTPPLEITSDDLPFGDDWKADQENLPFY